MSFVRPAAVAGMFYPGEGRVLADEVDEMLGGVESAPRLGYPKALVVPHAGYVYSGAIAARAYDELAAARGSVRRVVLLGPVHRVAVKGLALPEARAFLTPLGTVRLDAEAMAAARELPQVITSAAAHAREHSLEVQLPFLQRVLGDFELVPFAVGRASVQEVAQVIERLWGGPETLIVISTDLSHYHAYDEAQRIDGSTLGRIARRKGLSIRQLGACNSGDTAGSKDRVVGYSAFALHEPGATLDEAGRTLLSIARASIEHSLSGKPAPADDAGWLRQIGATFVTLTRDDRLRGCIGSLQPARPLGQDVAANALGAAFRDPRFPAMTAAEWPQCRVEVSLLSTPKPLHFGDEEDLLEKLVPGEDGLILEADGKRGTFLPQVWEQLRDKRTFLAHLLKKAGLPADTRFARCRIQRYRVAKWKE
jgi:AmmeMemoRadiSam system protein B/AmmeMemoRadiSam system protein A